MVHVKEDSQGKANDTFLEGKMSIIYTRHDMKAYNVKSMIIGSLDFPSSFCTMFCIDWVQIERIPLENMEYSFR